MVFMYKFENDIKKAFADFAVNIAVCIILFMILKNHPIHKIKFECLYTTHSMYSDELFYLKSQAVRFFFTTQNDLKDHKLWLTVQLMVISCITYSTNLYCRLLSYGAT